ncbi:MAG: tRNA pseudouridine(13) synthase TruD, partial [Promethearchaeota archaeon]
IILRNINLNNGEEQIEHLSDNKLKFKQILNSTTKQIDKKGFPNFFGLQRFGSHRPNSHLIGKYMFLKRYKEMVEEFLFESYPRETEMVKICRDDLKNTQDFKTASRNFPAGLFYERILIEYLVKNQGKYKNAILKLPRALLNLLYSAYQSYLFNVVVSKRKEIYDTLNVPIKGDRISILINERGLNTPVIYNYGKFYDEYLDKALNIDRATILCPIIGYNTDLTQSFFGPKYRELLEQEGFSQNSFKNSDLSSFNYKGTYRPIYVKPRSFSAKINKKSKKIKSPHLKLEFSLPKGTYATMLIREILKD